LGHLLLGLLDVLQKEVELSRGLSEVANNNDGSSGVLRLGVTLLVELAKASPDTELLAILNGQEVDLVLVAEGLNETLVGGLIAALSEDAKVSILTVKSLNGLTETTGQTVMLEGLLQDGLQSLEVVHGLLGLLNSGGGGSGISKQ
jgi:hypothetical protein